MDVLRTGYTTGMRFYNDSDQVTPIKWYLVSDDTPIFDGYHRFASRNYGNRWRYSPLGETTQKPVWSPGANLEPYLARNTCGRTYLFLAGASINDPTFGPNADGYYDCQPIANILPLTAVSWSPNFSTPSDVFDDQINNGSEVLTQYYPNYTEGKFITGWEVLTTNDIHDLGPIINGWEVRTEYNPGGGSSCCTGSNPATFTATFTNTPSNGSCSNCGAYPLVYTLTFVSDDGMGTCVWEGDYFDPCMLTTRQATLTIGGGEANFIIGGSDVVAYRLASGFDCDTGNVLDFMLAGPNCTNWEPTVLVEKV